MAMAVYLPVARAGFIWDDTAALHENPLLALPGGLWKIWTTHGRIPNESHFWPLIYTTYWLEYRLWGLEPLGYHLVNVALHAANVMLLWFLLRQIDAPGAWLAAAIFALHPVHVESVAWIHERKDVLSMFFYLLAFIGFVEWVERRGRAWIFVVPAFFLLGMFSKSVVVTLPVALAIWLWWRGKPMDRPVYILVGLLFFEAAALALFDMAMVRRVEHPDFGFGVAEKVLLAGRALVFYAEKFILPVNLTTIYPKWDVLASNPLHWLYPLAGVAVALALWLLRRRIGRAPLACYLFFAITLAPTLGLVDFSFMEIALVADRFQYLASAGFCALVGAGADLLVRRSNRGVVLAMCACVLILLSVLTWRQAARYENLETLFASAIEQNPASPHAHNNLGTALAKSGRHREALTRFEEAVRLKPDFALARNNLGWVHAELGERTEAVNQYREALRLGFRSPKMINDLAWYLATATDPNIANPVEALDFAKQAIRQAGENEPSMLDTLAAAQAANGNFETAAATAARAVLIARAQKQPALAAEIQTRLELYRKNQPYRE